MLKQMVHMFAILRWVFIQKSDYLQITLEFERQNEKVRYSGKIL